MEKYIQQLLKTGYTQSKIAYDGITHQPMYTINIYPNINADSPSYTLKFSSFPTSANPNYQIDLIQWRDSTRTYSVLSSYTVKAYDKL